MPIEPSSPPEKGKNDGEEKERFFVSSDAKDEIEVLHMAGSFDSTSSMDEIQTLANPSIIARREEERAFFQKARTYLNPGWLFRSIVYYYGERKLLVFFLIHFVSTLIVWVHFALIKFEQQADKVPDGAPRYWWKRLAPPAEFGSMHALLFQMALIPLTMSRYSIASLSESVVNKVVPLNRALRMHIHLGYTLVIIVVLSSLLFFAFFGLLCSDGDEAFCEKFTSEIMITGYSMLACLLIIGLTSYYRYKIPYEVFYVIHHLVFIFYFITIAHTFDIQARRGRERSQTFKWFSSTLAFYLCDRAAMHLNHWYEARLQGSAVVEAKNGSKMVILRVNRPALFRFRPGQFALLRINEIDNQWHPFSIASYPDSSELEFYIEVIKGKTWTKGLHDLLEANSGKAGVSPLSLKVELMGPYGTSIAKTDEFSHVVAIGAGTGVVPILSLYKQQIRDLLRLEPSAFFAEIKSREKKARLIQAAEEPRKASLCQKIFFGWSGKPVRPTAATRNDIFSASIRKSVDQHEKLSGKNVRLNAQEMKKAAYLTTKSIYGVVALSFLPVLGVTLFALTISWNTTPAHVYPGMVDILKGLTVIFQFMFALVAMFVWDGNGIFSFIDIVMCLISPFTDWYWFKVCNEHGSLRPTDITTYSILTLYMTFRLWAKTVSPRHSTWYRAVSRGGSRSKVDKLSFIWTTRSASQVSEILPEILALWNMLVDKWGFENATEVCGISIYVTDNDENACRLLRGEVENTDLYRMGSIRFERADFSRVLEDHSIDLVCTRGSSHSLLAFCGSPSLGSKIHSLKISNDMVLAITGNKKHQMEFVSEIYGGVRKVAKPTQTLNQDQEAEEMRPLTTRKHVRYGIARRASLRDLMTFGRGGSKK